MTSSPKWQDLAPRLLSGLALIVIGVVEVWLGGWIFRLTVCAVGGLMVWEAARMFESETPVVDGVLAAFALLVVTLLSALFVFPVLVAAALVSAGRVLRDKGLYIVFFLWILVTCLVLLKLRDQAGMIWFLWLVCVVVATDITGYFAGRIFGGPKFWPAISPKKTWSGTIAGWVFSGAMGAAFMAPTETGPVLILVSVILGFASQMGDIAESAVKRRMQVKDSSHLIPGHGGVLDRFDGLMGAGAACAVLWFAYKLGAGL